MNQEKNIDRRRRLMMLALWVPLMFTLVLALLARQAQHARDLDSQWLLHTVQVKSQLEHLNSLVKDVETSLRGYLLTTDTNFFPLYEKTRQEIPGQLQNLAKSIADNPIQVAATAQLRILIAEKLAVAAQTLSLARQGKISDAVQLVKSGKGKELMDEIRPQVDAMTAEEDRLLKLREDAFTAEVKSQKILMTGLVLADITLIVAATFLVQRLQQARQKALAQTEQANTLTEKAEARMEQTLHASELSYRRLFEAAQDGIMILDVDTGRINEVNPSLFKLLGFARSEMIGKTVGELSPFKSLEPNRVMLERLQKSGYVRYEDLTLETRDDRHITVEFAGNVYEAGDKKLIQCNLRDITERKRVEAQIRALNAELEQRAGERLQLEAQFIEAQKMQVIGQLAAGIAHDFNNILGVIIGYGDLITSDLDSDSPLRKYTGEIQHASARAAGLTRQLLIFSRKQTVQPVVLDLNGVVKDLDKMLHRLVDENITLTMALRKETGRVKADPGYVGQVLMNLVVNARDAMPNGGKLAITTINVTLDEDYVRNHTGAIAGDYVMLSVSDTGTGMTDEVKKRLFEAFFTTKPVGKGTGLGLATCQTIVQQSGGCIEVQSELGKGTTFKIYFPRVEQPIDITIKTVETSPLPRGTETLLLVEDEPSVRHLACNILEAQGYHVLRANNGQDALHEAREHRGAPIRLAITDVIMPLMNGKVMAEWLQTAYPDLKILFTSGYTDDAIAHHGVLEPGIAFLSKPYTPAILARKVRAMLDDATDTAMLRKQGVTN